MCTSAISNVKFQLCGNHWCIPIYLRKCILKPPFYKDDNIHHYNLSMFMHTYSTTNMIASKCIWRVVKRECVPSYSEDAYRVSLTTHMYSNYPCTHICVRPLQCLAKSPCTLCDQSEILFACMLLNSATATFCLFFPRKVTFMFISTCNCPEAICVIFQENLFRWLSCLSGRLGFFQF